MRAHLTHVLAAVRDLTRLELVTEAVRAVLEEAARTADHLLTGLVDEDWGRRYGRPVRLGKNPHPAQDQNPRRRRRRLPAVRAPPPAGIGLPAWPAGRGAAADRRAELLP